MDATLSWPRRLAIRLHLLYCLGCRRYAAQVRFLRRASQALGSERLDTLDQRLSDEAKQQMVTRLRAALEEPPSKGS